MDPFFGLFYPIRCMLFHRFTPGLVFNASAEFWQVFWVPRTALVEVALIQIFRQRPLQTSRFRPFQGFSNYACQWQALEYANQYHRLVMHPFDFPLFLDASRLSQSPTFLFRVYTIYTQGWMP